MNESPLVILIFFAGALYMGKIWLDDLKAYKSGTPNLKAFPGATPCPGGWILVACLVSIGLVGVETAGEYALGVSEEQSDIPALLLLGMLAAGFVEELVFRGYLVVTRRGKGILILSIIGVSFLFALGHFQYYTTPSESGPWYDFSWNLNTKSAWTLSILFLNSLWFYAVRFLPPNPQRSLLPCFAAHIASNLAVFFVKLAQGHVLWSWSI